MIAHETNVVATSDPLGGAYFVEELTDELERQAYAYFDRIRRARRGGRGDQAELLPGRDRRVGVPLPARGRDRRAGRSSASTSSSPDGEETPILRIDPELEGQQIARVRELRSRRDSPAAEAALERLGADAARDDVNLMPAIIEAARADVTMGEMCDALRSVWGVWRETPVF